MRIWIGNVFWTVQHVLIMRFFFSVKNQAVYFLLRKPKQDNGYIKKEIQAVSIPKYYLDFAEYNEGKLDKIAIFLYELKKIMYNRFPCYGVMICFRGRKNHREKKLK